MSNIGNKLVTDTMTIDDLVDEVTSGRVRIPSFQRGLKWTRADVIKLFDSIVQGYPIGNLLLWKRPAGAHAGLQIGALTIDAQEESQALFVVDGQQRLTSLANALNEEGQSDGRFALAYDVAKQTFVPNNGKSPAQIPLPVIFDLTRLMQWLQSNPSLMAEADALNRATAVAKAIRQFKVPVYIVDQDNEDVLRDIFDRMNNYGKQLTRAEIFSALHEAGTGERDQEDSGQELPVIAQAIHAATGFGVLDDATIFLAILSRRGWNVSRDIRREFGPQEALNPDQEFAGESPSDSRRGAQIALVRAVRFLQDDAYVPHMAFLPYRYLLVVLARFFAHFPDPSQATRRNLRRWYWRAAGRGPDFTKGNFTAATRTLGAKIIPGQESLSLQGMLQLVGAIPPAVPDVTWFRTSYGATRLLLGVMWHKKPRHLAPSFRGRSFSLEELHASLGERPSAVNETPFVVRDSSIPRETRQLSGNRMLIPDVDGVEPEAIMAALRLIASEDTSQSRKILSSHFIDAAGIQAILSDDLLEFITNRQSTMTQGIVDFLEAQAEWKFEDTPPLASLMDDDDFLAEEEGSVSDEFDSSGYIDSADIETRIKRGLF